ncbi:hypothetical protein HBI70_052940 [Parastagonospora nodorum]|nr:hypothetical protein HBI75_220630 [Parastagonospora nodorum]KAH5284055.1 hypothetical protein HBI70_052940 [Parastagonospora nodorum]KAH5435253.1 hypothetical protein HBI32_032960 [Parastagonospora nodorum]KAH5507870.1 hypothetical protein HBI31_046940 [Parastagonospora nodorum]
MANHQGEYAWMDLCTPSLPSSWINSRTSYGYPESVIAAPILLPSVDFTPAPSFSSSHSICSSLHPQSQHVE